MRKFVCIGVVCGALAPATSFSQESDAEIVGRDIGAILAWRLSPELVEEKCRDVDPAGATVRADGLKSWQEKNAKLIAEVDARVAEIVPLAYPSPTPTETVAAVREQVKKILLETISAEGDAEKLKAACQADAKPESPRWAYYKLPHVQNSLAALYDWQTQREKK